MAIAAETVNKINKKKKRIYDCEPWNEVGSTIHTSHHQGK